MFQYKFPTTSFASQEEMIDFFSNKQNLSHHYQLIENTKNLPEIVPEIETILLRGSLGKENGDIFSDIDIVILHDENETKTIKIKDIVLAHIHEIGEIVHYFYNTNNLNDLIIYFKPFVKYDLSIRSIGSMKNRWNIANAQLLFDRTHKGTLLLEEAKNISFILDKHLLEIQNFGMNIPSMCYTIAGYVVRGEHISSIDDLDWLRNSMLKISGWLLGQWDEGPRRAEKRFPQKVINYYNRSRVKDVNEVWGALKIILNWFVFWLVPIFNELQISHALHEVEFVKQLLNLLQSKY